MFEETIGFVDAVNEVTFMARTPTFHVVSNVHVVFLKNSQEICEQLAPSFFKQTCILSTGALAMPRVREDAIV